MTKTEIIDHIAQSGDMSREMVHHIVDAFLDKIKESISKEEEVQIRGFGTFFNLKKKPRKIYSPIVKKKIDVPEKITIGFKASKVAEEQLNNKEGA